MTPGACLSYDLRRVAQVPDGVHLSRRVDSGGEPITAIVNVVRQ